MNIFYIVIIGLFLYNIDKACVCYIWANKNEVGNAMYRVFSLICVLSLLMASVSCVSDDNDVVTTNESSQSEVETTELFTVEIKDFDNYDFRFYTYSTGVDMYAPEEETGDIVNDAVYRRNREIEEMYNITISTIDSGTLNEREHRDAINTMINAGDEACDVVLNIGKQLANQALDGYYINMYDIEEFDFDKSWWSKQLVEDLSFSGCMYFCSNNLHYEEFAASKVFYFNKDKIDEYQLDDPYELVLSGKWVINRMIEMTRDVNEDLNGNNIADNEDFYGLLTTVSHNAWAVCFDIPVWEKNNDSIELVAMSDKMLNAFDKIHSWYYDSIGLYTWDSYSKAINEMRDMFKAGQGMFVFGFVGDSGTYYRDTDVDYGIVPFPKYDENQENYRVFFGANTSNMFAIPIFASDKSRTGLILEALSAKGYEELIPVYYEVALKDKYMRDETSVEILDIITENRTISFSYCYDNWDAGLGFGNCFQSEFKDSFSTFYAARENIVKSRIQKVVEAFT